MTDKVIICAKGTIYRANLQIFYSNGFKKIATIKERILKLIDYKGFQNKSLLESTIFIADFQIFYSNGLKKDSEHQGKTFGIH